MCLIKVISSSAGLARKIWSSVKMEGMAIHSLALDLLVVIAGLAVGSFLNVLSLRTLQGESIIWPPSHCPRCDRGLLPQDNIPVLSYIFLRGRCRFCRAPISWQYPAVELATALSFLILLLVFGPTLYAAGMAVLVCTLIAVTVTDIREKLIPHDITYPSMLVGIGFSSFVRGDLGGAMMGIGASYILFDFLAHYGLKLYIHFHTPHGEDQEAENEIDESVDNALGLTDTERAAGEEEIEVMGGGDAVLSAVIAAYLGWQRLLAALFVGFIVGTAFGIILLIVEMKRANLIREAVRPMGIGAVIGFAALGITSLVTGTALGLPASMLPWLQFGCLGAAAGGLLGLISVGTRVSKPFPFGPALAAGGFAAIFWNPVGSMLNGGA